MSKIVKGSCHCGTVEFEVKLESDLDQAQRCDCSMCRRRSAYMAHVKLEGLEVTKGADNLSLYQWNTKTAKHYFCKTCGIYTHHQRRSNPEEYGFNIACIEGINPYELGREDVADGINHPKDQNLNND